MNIVYMGTPAFAVPPLKRLIEEGHQVSAVVTQPDRPVGRGRKMQMPPVKEFALAHHLQVLQPEKLKKQAFDKVLSVFHPDLIVVAAYGRILPQEILNLPRFGCLNIHASLLPKYRGAAPIQWAIINGERVTGVTIMQMNEGLDTGNIISFEQVEILEDDDTRSVTNMLSITGAELMVRTVRQIEETGRVESVPQDDSQACYAPMISRKDGLLDWNLSNDEIIFRIKGLQPWPAAFSFLHGRAWKFLKAEPFEDETGLIGEEVDERGRPMNLLDPGEVILLVRGKGFVVKTGDGYLLITEVQPPDKKAMKAVDAMNGKLIKSRDAFISAPEFLEGSREEN